MSQKTCLNTDGCRIDQSAGTAVRYFQTTRKLVMVRSESSIAMPFAPCKGYFSCRHFCSAG